MVTTQPIPAYILTSQSFDSPSGICIEYWVVSPNGPLKIIFTEQKIILFIEDDDLEKAKLLISKYYQINYDIKSLTLKTFSHKKVVALYFSGQKTFNQITRLLRDNHITCYEADIKIADRYLMERFITGGVLVYSESSANQIYNPKLKPTGYLPCFKIVSLDIETSSQIPRQLYSIAVYAVDQTHHNTHHRVFMHTEKANNDARVNNSLNISYFTDIAHLLEAFFDWFRQYDPDIIIGWHVIQFDLKELYDLCQQLKIPFCMQRGNHAVKFYTQDNGFHHLNIPGRIVLDGIECLKTAHYNFKTFSLDYVSKALLKQGKTIANDDNKTKTIDALYHNNKEKLAEYNLNDCQLVWQIFKEQGLIEFVLERSQLTGLAMDQLAGSVKAFDYLYLPRLHRQGYIAPNKIDHQNLNTSPGGYVLNSKPGIYQNIIVLDFKSLYPSIIRTFKIDPLGLVNGLVEQTQKNTNVIVGYDNAVFSRNNSILPDIITTLWEARDLAKQQKNLALSNAIKLLMNSFYGVMGTALSRFYDPRLSSSITRRGHGIIKTSRNYIESLGFQVIYGDTDSLFVSIKQLSSDSSVTQVGQSLADKLNQYWQDRLMEQYHIASYLEVEFEIHYQRFIMPTIRNSKQGSKKRYAGIIAQPDGTTVLAFKGLEAIRSDWTDLAKEFQYQLYFRILEDKPYHTFIQKTVFKLLKGQLDNKLIYRKRLRKPLSSYYKNAPQHVQAIRKLDGDSIDGIKPGDWVEYIITYNGPQLATEQKSAIDYNHYIDKQLIPIADSVLHFIGQSFDQIVNPGLNI